MKIVAILTFLSLFCVSCIDGESGFERLRWRTPFDHLVPLSMEWNDIPRDDIVSFRAGGGLGPTVGWSLKRSGRKIEDSVYIVVLWTEEKRELARVKISSNAAFKIHMVFLELVLETRYPAIEEEEPGIITIGPLDAAIEQFFVRAEGLGELVGEVGAWRSQRIMDFVDFQRGLFELNNSGELLEDRIIKILPKDKS